MKVRFEEWRATETPIMESELPSGVRYGRPGYKYEYMAIEGNRFVITKDSGGDPCALLGIGGRLRLIVTILDWPNWCGPHPDTKTERPKMSDAAKMVGTGGIVAVVSTNCMGEVQTFDRWDIDRLSAGDGRCDPYYTFLGFIIAEETS